MRKWLAIFALLALTLPPVAGAHAFLEASTPATGASLAHAPHTVSLVFTEPVSAALTHVQLVDGRGAAIGSARIARGRTARELRIHLPGLATGAYRLTYSTVSQDDLHVTRGALTFGVGVVAPPGRPEAATTPRTSISESVAHLFDLTALCVLIAICALLASELPTAVRSRILRFAAIALPALLLAGAVALAGKTSDLPLRTVLAHTAWGHAMVVRELAILATLIAVATRQRRLAVALLDTGRGGRGRERARRLARRGRSARDDAAHPGGRTLGRRADRARARAARPRPPRCHRHAHPFRAAGRDQRAGARRHGPLQRRSSGDEPRRRPFDHVRLVPRRQGRPPRSDRLRGPARAPRAAACPTVGPVSCGPRRSWAVGILAAASLLLASAPARGPQFAPSARPIMGTPLASGRAADLLVDLSAAPNRPGQNFVTATVLDTLRPSPGPVRRVTITFSRGDSRITLPATRARRHPLASRRDAADEAR